MRVAGERPAKYVPPGHPSYPVERRPALQRFQQPIRIATLSDKMLSLCCCQVEPHIDGEEGATDRARVVSRHDGGTRYGALIPTEGNAKGRVWCGGSRCAEQALYNQLRRRWMHTTSLRFHDANPDSRRRSS